MGGEQQRQQPVECHAQAVLPADEVEQIVELPHRPGSKSPQFDAKGIGNAGEPPQRDQVADVGKVERPARAALPSVCSRWSAVYSPANPAPSISTRFLLALFTFLPFPITVDPWRRDAWARAADHPRDGAAPEPGAARAFAGRHIS